MSICGLRLYFTDRSGGVGNRALGAVRSLCRREQTLSYLGNQLTAAAGPPLLTHVMCAMLLGAYDVCYVYWCSCCVLCLLARVRTMLISTHMYALLLIGTHVCYVYWYAYVC